MSKISYLAVFDGDHVAEVVFDWLHRVSAPDDVRGLLRNHHLSRVRVASHRVGNDRRVHDPESLHAAHPGCRTTGW